MEDPNLTTKQYTTKVKLHENLFHLGCPKTPRVTRSTMDCKGSSNFLEH
jgi:hypothetical protein